MKYVDGQELLMGDRVQLAVIGVALPLRTGAPPLRLH